MNYTIEGTTKRYTGNPSCSYPTFIPAKDNLCQYGCEFEFYIDTDRYNYTKAIEALTQNIYSLTHADILVDEFSLPSATDRNRCMQIKPDISLQDHGVEISVPISTKEGIIHYINTITPVIERYGYTNEETGFHIHISTLQNDGSHIDFYRFMLLCDDADLLASWKPREGYSQNVMDILLSNTKQEARVIKSKKGTIWNLERIDTHHIEIKSIGGINYHQEPRRIIKEFEAYAVYFVEAIGDMTKEHKALLFEHKKVVDALSMERKANFASALGEAGILNTKTS
jgi:hypothetical protein